MNQEIQKILENFQNYQTFDFTTTLVNFFFCIVLSFIVKKFYLQYSTSLTGKQHIGNILITLSLVVFLVISIVKSSIALSLGLVGALSIVRFRTPIKEPEELVYLFLAIGVGLGYAAGHTWLTTFITLLILLTIYYWSFNKKQSINEYNLVISWNNEKISIEQLSSSVLEFVISLKFNRIDKISGTSTVVMSIIPKEISDIDKISKAINEIDSKIEISIYENVSNW
jgi:hypothetical protein